MCRIILILLLSLGLSCQALAQHDLSDKDQVLLLHELKFKWLSQVDTLALANLLADDVVYVHSNGWRESKQEVIQNIVSGKLTYTDVTVSSADVRQYGDSFIVNGIGVFKVALDGNPLTINLDYTEIYIKQDGKYILVSRHACRPNP